MPIYEIEQREGPFKHAKVYFSGSIHGISNGNPNLSWDLVQFMANGGALVLDPHVAGRTQEEKDRLFIETRGFDCRAVDNPWFMVEEEDIAEVDQATHLVAVVDGPSHGVGNEIQRAIDNWELKRPRKRIEILCLVHEDNLAKLSWMLRGKERKKYPQFHIQTYKGIEDAQITVGKFLLGI